MRRSAALFTKIRTRSSEWELSPHTFRLSPSKRQGIGPLEKRAVPVTMRREFESDIRAPRSMNRAASVVWEGNLREGGGTMSTESGVLFNTQYSFRTRFDEGIGTNPDELIAASLGVCFYMTISNYI